MGKAVTQRKWAEPLTKDPLSAPVHRGKLLSQEAPGPQHSLSLFLLFVSPWFSTTWNLLKMDAPLFREQIWKSGFWRYQNHLFLKLAALAVNIAPGWISSGEGGVIYFSGQAFLLSSTRNNKILTMIWKSENILKGKEQASPTPWLATTAGSLSDTREEKVVWDWELCDHGICSPLPAALAAPPTPPLPRPPPPARKLGDCPGSSLAIKGTGAHGASLRRPSKSGQDPLIENSLKREKASWEQMAWYCKDLSMNGSSTTYPLCGLGKMTRVLWDRFSHQENVDNNIHYPPGGTDCNHEVKCLACRHPSSKHWEALLLGQFFSQSL